MHTTIRINRETRSILSKIGHKNQTYDQIITELVKSKNKMDLLELTEYPNSSKFGHS